MRPFVIIDILDGHILAPDDIITCLDVDSHERLEVVQWLVIARQRDLDMRSLQRTVILANDFVESFAGHKKISPLRDGILFHVKYF